MIKKRGFFNSRLVIGTCRSPRGRAGAFPLPTTLSATFPSPFLATSHHHPSPPPPSPLPGRLVSGQGRGMGKWRGGEGWEVDLNMQDLKLRSQNDF